MTTAAPVRTPSRSQWRTSPRRSTPAPTRRPTRAPSSASPRQPSTTRAPLDTHTATIDWGDGTSLDTGDVTETPFGPPGSTLGADGTVDGSHVYADNGTYTVRSASPTTTAHDLRHPVVVVDNVAPSGVTASASPSTINENGSTTVNGTFIDPGTADTHTVTISWGDGSRTRSSPWPLAPGRTAPATPISTTTRRRPPRTPYTVGVTVEDDDLDTGSGSTSVTVNNVAPATSVLLPRRPRSTRTARPPSAVVHRPRHPGHPPGRHQLGSRRLHDASPWLAGVLTYSASHTVPRRQPDGHRIRHLHDRGHRDRR